MSTTNMQVQAAAIAPMAFVILVVCGRIYTYYCDWVKGSTRNRYIGPEVERDTIVVIVLALLLGITAAALITASTIDKVHEERLQIVGYLFGIVSASLPNLAISMKLVAISLIGNKIIRRGFRWIPIIQPLLTCGPVAIAIKQCALAKTHSVHENCLKTEDFVILFYNASAITVLIDALLITFVVWIAWPLQMPFIAKVKQCALTGLPVLVSAVITFIKCLHIKLSNDKSVHLVLLWVLFEMYARIICLCVTLWIQKLYRLFVPKDHSSIKVGGDGVGSHKTYQQGNGSHCSSMDSLDASDSIERNGRGFSESSKQLTFGREYVGWTRSSLSSGV